MSGMLWCQCFCLLMRRELSFLSMCNFLVCPWHWQLAYAKQINPQRSLCCHACGLCMARTLGAPRSPFSPHLSPLQWCCLLQSRETEWLFNFLLSYSIFVFLSSFSFWMSNCDPSFSTSFWLHVPLLLNQYLRSLSPRLGPAVAVSKMQQYEPTPAFLGHLGISCCLGKKPFSMSADHP